MHKVQTLLVLIMSLFVAQMMPLALKGTKKMQGPVPNKFPSKTIIRGKGERERERKGERERKNTCKRTGERSKGKQNPIHTGSEHARKAVATIPNHQSQSA